MNTKLKEMKLPKKSKEQKSQSQIEDHVVLDVKKVISEIGCITSVQRPYWTSPQINKNWVWSFRKSSIFASLIENYKSDRYVAPSYCSDRNNQCSFDRGYTHSEPAGGIDSPLWSQQINVCAARQGDFYRKAYGTRSGNLFVLCNSCTSWQVLE